MDQGPLVTQHIDAGTRFLHELTRHTPVRAAFWLKDSESHQWYLYITGDQIDDTKIRDVYGEVLRIALMIDDPWLDPFQVKVIANNTRLAKEVVEMQDKYPENRPTHSYGGQLGDLGVDEVYIYPPPLTVPI